MNNAITASRMSALLSCFRKHYWMFEVGLRKRISGVAATMGAAWHRAMESRWKSNATAEEALAAAFPDGVQLDKYDVARVAAMIIAYYQYYGEAESYAKLETEKKFAHPIVMSKLFEARGMIDRIGTRSADGVQVLVDYKTTRERVDRDSPYWLRLRFNTQLLQYLVGSRALGWDVSEIVYDVARKPQLRPANKNVLDDSGRKIIVDGDGKRLWKKTKAGKRVPVASGSRDGSASVKRRMETPDEFHDRLVADMNARPEFYFARREVPILEGDVKEFKLQVLAITKLILACREMELIHHCGPSAWPRHVSAETCTYCEYANFCLENRTVNLEQPPAGFEVHIYNPELNEPATTTQDAPESADDTGQAGT